ncbi:TPA: type VI secretion system baseplate subunit TssF [Escherichia coli]|nr:VasA [Escherichia coli]HDK2192247.1 type VI secretion system baseplate subunit TssF [Escherichia coli]
MEFEERYFREELDYLRQLSKLLATEKPHLARFLAEKDADPDIERLLEGVAFLTGNLRQKIEDEFPELTHGLIKMLWPNYLRPVPAMTLIEYTPDMDKSSVPVLIPRNEQFTTNAGEIRVDEVLPSDAKKEEPPPCTFTLCRDIWLLPVRLASTLYLHPEPFVCEGEMYLLGTVLSHFLSLYASVNSFHMLTVVNTESQETWKWTERIGQHPLI